MRTRRLLPLCVVLLTSSPAPAGPRAALRYRVEITGGSALALKVSAVAEGLGGPPEWTFGTGGPRDLMRDEVLSPDGTTLRYLLPGRALATAERDADVATPAGEGIIISDSALLQRPSELPPDARIEVEFITTPRWPVVAPWEPTGPDRYRMTTEQLDGGAYLLMGPHQVLPVNLKDNVLSAVVAERGHRASIPALTRWIERSAGMVATWNGGTLPVPRTQLILLPSPGERSGLFGTTMRWGLGSIVLYFGRDAPDAAFDGEWVAPHELFHLANPHLDGKVPWFTEGFTTYYQDVVRARAGARPVPEMWADLIDGFEHSCGSTHVQTLRQVSRWLHRTRQYLRVYWGGACVAFVVDVALREQTANARSLDDVFKALRARSLRPRGALTEEDLLATLRAELPASSWGRAWLEQALDGRRGLDLGALLGRLGLRRTGETVVEIPDAPWSPITRAIMGQPPARVPTPLRLPPLAHP